MKLISIKGTCRNNEVHSENGVIYKLTNSFTEYFSGYFLLERVINSNNKVIYKLLSFL